MDLTQSLQQWKICVGLKRTNMAVALSGIRTRPDEIGRVWKGGRESSRL